MVVALKDSDDQAGFFKDRLHRIDIEDCWTAREHVEDDIEGMGHADECWLAD